MTTATANIHILNRNETFFLAVKRTPRLDPFLTCNTQMSTHFCTEFLPNKGTQYAFYGVLINSFIPFFRSRKKPYKADITQENSTANTCTRKVFPIECGRVKNKSAQYNLQKNTTRLLTRSPSCETRIL